MALHLAYEKNWPHTGNKEGNREGN